MQDLLILISANNVSLSILSNKNNNFLILRTASLMLLAIKNHVQSLVRLGFDFSRLYYLLLYWSLAVLSLNDKKWYRNFAKPYTEAFYTLVNFSSKQSGLLQALENIYIWICKIAFQLKSTQAWKTSRFVMLMKVTFFWKFYRKLFFRQEN